MSLVAVFLDGLLKYYNKLYRAFCVFIVVTRHTFYGHTISKTTKRQPRPSIVVVVLVPSSEAVNLLVSTIINCYPVLVPNLKFRLEVPDPTTLSY